MLLDTKSKLGRLVIMQMLALFSNPPLTPTPGHYGHLNLRQNQPHTAYPPITITHTHIYILIIT